MRTRIKELKEVDHRSFIDKEIVIKGWVRTVRNQKTFAFIELNDGSTLSNFQIVANADLPDYEKIINQLL